MILTAPAEAMLTAGELRRTRGLTAAQIRALGKPDVLVVNERNPARPIKLWRASWVTRCELDSPGLQEHVA